MLFLIIFDQKYLCGDIGRELQPTGDHHEGPVAGGGGSRGAHGPLAEAGAVRVAGRARRPHGGRVRAQPAPRARARRAAPPAPRARHQRHLRARRGEPARLAPARGLAHLRPPGTVTSAWVWDLAVDHQIHSYTSIL